MTDFKVGDRVQPNIEAFEPNKQGTIIGFYDFIANKVTSKMCIVKWDNGDQYAINAANLDLLPNFKFKAGDKISFYGADIIYTILEQKITKTGQILYILKCTTKIEDIEFETTTYHYQSVSMVKV